MFSHAAPGGRAHVSIRSSSPDPSRRFSVTVSDGYYTGAEGLRELAERLLSFADEVDPRPKAKAKAKATPKPPKEADK